MILLIVNRSTTPRKSPSAPIGTWIGRRGRAEARANLADAVEEVRAHAVHLVDEDDARDGVLVRLAPHGLGLRLHGGDGVEERDEAVEHAQAALDLDREVNVAWRIDDVDARVAPRARRRSGRDRDPALLLLDHPVHGSGAVVDFTDLVRAAGIEKNPLRRRRLAGVDVSSDPDVSGVFERIVALESHEKPRGMPITSGSGRKLCWLPPSCACPRAF